MSFLISKTGAVRLLPHPPAARASSVGKSSPRTLTSVRHDRSGRQPVALICEAYDRSKLGGDPWQVLVGLDDGERLCVAADGEDRVDPSAVSLVQQLLPARCPLPGVRCE